MNIYITGDTHRDFDRIKDFCEKENTSNEDIIIILGDAGINYYLFGRDNDLKAELNTLPVTLFCIHGNHEERPYNIPSYEEQPWHGGTAYIEPAYPNLIFGKDGEIYDFNGRKYIVIGGAYSIDKSFRLQNGWNWFESEQPDDDTKAYTEQQLDSVDWKIYGVLTHTMPKAYEPSWAFLSGIDPEKVDKSTELWLDKIEKRLTYEKWYAGHYHVDSQEGPIKVMFRSVERLG